ncbi:SDR family NAD(P)-dependent oxidoreductase [Lacibacterium aquatile]|uniref:SDR family NAD(P)-dependent oxidoreductase n=1 Tax=Lacibacterium aquatile TaxID=1168082 RepID=A0ABW5DVK4_9PROT
MKRSLDLPLKGRRAVVTGAGRGIGAAIARTLAEQGAEVSIIGRTQATLQEVALEIGASAYACDITNTADYAEVMGEVGAVDILVNNAGAADSAPFLKTDADMWRRMFDINLMAAVEGCRLVLPGMIERKWGRIITVASTAGLKGYAYVTPYVAAKHAVVGLTKALALEVAKSGVTVNAVCPGYTDTDLIARAVDTIVAKTGRDVEAAKAGFHNPQGRLIQPEDVANAVLWLAGEGAGSVTGQAVPVAGGEI